MNCKVFKRLKNVHDIQIHSLVVTLFVYNRKTEISSIIKHLSIYRKATTLVSAMKTISDERNGPPENKA